MPKCRLNGHLKTHWRRGRSHSPRSSESSHLSSNKNISGLDAHGLRSRVIPNNPVNFLCLQTPVCFREVWVDSWDELIQQNRSVSCPVDILPVIHWGIITFQNSLLHISVSTGWATSWKRYSWPEPSKYWVELFVAWLRNRLQTCFTLVHQQFSSLSPCPHGHERDS